MTQNQTQAIGHENYPTCVDHRTASPKFSFISLYNQLFSRYSTYQDFLIDSHVKI